MFISFLLLFFTSIIHPVADSVNNKNQSVRAVDPPPSYRVRYLPKNDIRVDGNVSDKSWETCEVIDSLSAPWDAGTTGTEEFRACYDVDFFYFSFVVKDSVGLFLNEKNENAVAKGDRVELFLSSDTTMNNYYCFEIAPNGNVLDYQASYHRKFNSAWNIEGAEIVATPNANGYVVEGKLPVAFLKELKNPKISSRGNVIRAGVFRAKKKSVSDPEAFTWYSWMRPRASSPDFHIPSALGSFEF